MTRIALAALALAGCATVPPLERTRRIEDALERADRALPAADRRARDVIAADATAKCSPRAYPIPLGDEPTPESVAACESAYAEPRLADWTRRYEHARSKVGAALTHAATAELAIATGLDADATLAAREALAAVAALEGGPK